MPKVNLSSSLVDKMRTLSRSYVCVCVLFGLFRFSNFPHCIVSARWIRSNRLESPFAIRFYMALFLVRAAVHILSRTMCFRLTLSWYFINTLRQCSARTVCARREPESSVDDLIILLVLVVVSILFNSSLFWFLVGGAVGRSVVRSVFGYTSSSSSTWAVYSRNLMLLSTFFFFPHQNLKQISSMLRYKRPCAALTALPARKTLAEPALILLVRYKMTVKHKICYIYLLFEWFFFPPLLLLPEYTCQLNGAFDRLTGEIAY